MAWTIEFDEAAVKSLRKLPPQQAKRIRDFLRDRIAPSLDPRQTGSALGTLWRYRVGAFRVLCELQYGRRVVLVVEIGPRKEIYR